MSKITYFFATISPYTYLAGLRLEGVAKKHGLGIDYRPLDLPALFSRTGGLVPKDRHPNRQAWRLQELVRQSKMVDLPLNIQPAFWPTNMAPSSYAFISAKNHGDGDLGALAHGLTKACWVEEKNIAEADVIADCLRAAGFDASLADKDMMGSAEEYARNLEDAVTMGAFGAPFYITPDDQRFWGQDSIAALDLYLSGQF